MFVFNETGQFWGRFLNGFLLSSLIIEDIFFRFVIVSNWKNENALDQHLKENHVKEFAKSFENHTIVEHIRRYEKIE